MLPTSLVQHHPVVPFVLQNVAFGDFVQQVLQFGCIEEVYVFTGGTEEDEEAFFPEVRDTIEDNRKAIPRTYLYCNLLLNAPFDLR